MHLLRSVGKTSTLMNGEGDIGSSVVGKVIEHPNDGAIVEAPLVVGVTIVVFMEDGDGWCRHRFSISKAKGIHNA
jgi:hypothetical protein